VNSSHGRRFGLRQVYFPCACCGPGKPARGRFYWTGEPLAQPSRPPRAAMVFQRYSYSALLTVLGNVMLGPGTASLTLLAGCSYWATPRGAGRSVCHSGIRRLGMHWNVPQRCPRHAAGAWLIARRLVTDTAHPAAGRTSARWTRGNPARICMNCWSVTLEQSGIDGIQIVTHETD